MKFDNTEIYGIKSAMRGMRNPLESWSKGDTLDCIEFGECEICPLYNGRENCYGDEVVIGKNDMSLAQKLILAGSEHRKFLRQIFVSVDITAPLYWWKEFDTYKVGTTANSTSTMHKLSTTPITLNSFEIDDVDLDLECLDTHDYESSTIAIEVETIIDFLEDLRKKYLETKDKRYWKELIRWLPESWLQTRTVTMNYENLYSIYRQRRNHKLTEWSESFIKWVDSLPYSNELIKCGLEDN